MCPFGAQGYPGCTLLGAPAWFSSSAAGSRRCRAAYGHTVRRPRRPVVHTGRGLRVEPLATLHPPDGANSGRAPPSLESLPRSSDSPPPGGLLLRLRLHGRHRRPRCQRRGLGSLPLKTQGLGRGAVPISSFVQKPLTGVSGQTVRLVGEAISRSLAPLCVCVFSPSTRSTDGRVFMDDATSERALPQLSHEFLPSALVRQT